MSEVMRSKIITPQEDPENAAVRSLVSKRTDDPVRNFGPLLKKTENIHAAWLFENIEPSYKVLQSLCLSLSSYSVIDNSGWYNFGGRLDIGSQRIEVISYMNDFQKDKTELCLLTFAQGRNSTFGPIIKTLMDLNRLDALSKARTEIENLLNFIESPEGQDLWDLSSRHLLNTSANDSGMFSVQSTNTTETDNIIRPKIWRTLFHRLPISLKDLENMFNLLAEPQTMTPDLLVNENFQQAVPERISWEQQYFQSVKNKTVFLTFASDGKAAAERIAFLLNTQTEKREKYGVLILDENKKVLSQNPEITIVTLFNMFDYIMPILTKGYLKAIKRRKSDLEATNALASWDNRYARFINSLMYAELTGNACLNKRFHCVVPKEVNFNTIYKDVQSHLIFRSWIKEAQLDSFVQKLL